MIAAVLVLIFRYLPLRPPWNHCLFTVVATVLAAPVLTPVSLFVVFIPNGVWISFFRTQKDLLFYMFVWTETWPISLPSTVATSIVMWMVSQRFEGRVA